MSARTVTLRRSLREGLTTGPVLGQAPCTRVPSCVLRAKWQLLGHAHLDGTREWMTSPSRWDPGAWLQSPSCRPLCQTVFLKPSQRTLDETRGKRF